MSAPNLNEIEPSQVVPNGEGGIVAYYDLPGWCYSIEYEPQHVNTVDVAAYSTEENKLVGRRLDKLTATWADRVLRKLGWAEREGRYSHPNFSGSAVNWRQALTVAASALNVDAEL